MKQVICWCTVAINGSWDSCQQMTLIGIHMNSLRTIKGQSSPFTSYQYNASRWHVAEGTLIQTHLQCATACLSHVNDTFQLLADSCRWRLD